MQEKELLLDEFRKGVSPAKILAAKLFFTAFFALFETGIVYAFLAGSISVFPSVPLWITLCATILPAAAAGLLLSTFARNPGQANAFLPLVILPQIALSGALVPKDQMTDIAQKIALAIWTLYDQSAMQDVFMGMEVRLSDWALPIVIAILIYIVSIIALKHMKTAK